MRTIKLIALLLILAACQDRSQQELINEISALQLQAHEAPENEGFPYLEQAAVLLKANPQLPDSLKITNYYLKGNSFRTRGLLDSAATQLFKATSLINDSIVTIEQQAIYKEA